MSRSLRVLRLGIILMCLACSTLSVSAEDPKDCYEQKKQYCSGKCIEINEICLLEPFPSMDDNVIKAGTTNDVGIFFYYINSGIWTYALGFGAAIAVLNAAAGGLQIVLSNGDSGKIDAGKTRFISSAIGLIVLILAGVILAFINPLGFSST